MSYVVAFRGFPACPCLAEWLPVFERMLIFRGVIRESIDIAQLIGGAKASGGTHTDGGAFDVWQHDPETQRVGRQMGAATWNRIAPWWSGSAHSHGVLNGCPHNGPARYQIAALADGYSGLGTGGRGSRDYGPGPQRLRTWRQGIVWANKQMEDDMPYTDWPEKDKKALIADLAPAIAAEAAKAVLGAEVTNKAADGTVQGEITVSAMFTNLERSQDQRFHQLKELISNLTLTTEPPK